MKRIESGEGATDLGSTEQVTIVAGDQMQVYQPTIAFAVEEIDNLRACIAELHAWAEPHSDSLRTAQVLGILEKHGL